MPKANFPGPRYNEIIEKDKQIIHVPLEHVEWGARRVSTQTPVKNEQTIQHVPNAGNSR